MIPRGILPFAGSRQAAADGPLRHCAARQDSVAIGAERTAKPSGPFRFMGSRPSQTLPASADPWKEESGKGRWR